ncbi:glycosyltransferase [Vibrio artabrorum]|uniref:Glycosyltransferase n=2 Tax=Vibrio artabrorum TaxID=446374 RepID=A0ABT8CHR5_9VIBR|nr:glycosyltransferase [Vibrio artabrorum]MDN3700437.1 glycosyltransferase [Vibrio artabrorum]
MVVATSQKYLDSSLDLKGFYSKCGVIPIGVKRLPPLPKDVIHKYRLENDFDGKKIIFSLGRLTYYKGFDFLIEAARYLPDDYLILIGGEGELKQSLIDKIESVGVSNRVKLLGRLTDEELNVYFNISDVFCLPSVHRSEAFGLVQAEAMSLGKPVVSTDIVGSGVSWVNKHGYSGIVVPPQNSQLLAKGFLDIFDNYNMFSFEAKKRYENHFTVDKMLSSFEALYFELKNNE